MIIALLVQIMHCEGLASALAERNLFEPCVVEVADELLHCCAFYVRAI